MKLMFRWKNSCNWDGGTAIFPVEKVKDKTLRVDNIGELQEKITEDEEVKEIKD